MKTELDIQNISECVTGILCSIPSENYLRDGLRGTPDRVARAYKELLCGYSMDPYEILNTRFSAPYDEMVIVKDLEFWSLCEHHLMPFHGTATIAYIPSKQGWVVGLSKLGRLLECFSRRLQIQERMTQEIAEAIRDGLLAEGVGVTLSALHTCMAMRGVKKPGTMVTSCLLGVMRETGARSEFLQYATT